MNFIDWLKSFPIDENGTPSGKLTPGVYWFILIELVIIFGFIGILKFFS